MKDSINVNSTITIHFFLCILYENLTLYRGGSRISSQGGRAHLKKLRRAEGGAKMSGVFRVKNRQKIIFLFGMVNPIHAQHVKISQLFVRGGIPKLSLFCFLFFLLCIIILFVCFILCFALLLCFIALCITCFAI